MRQSPVMQDVLDRAEEVDDIVEVGGDGGDETDEHAPAERQGLFIDLRGRRRPREQRAGKRVGQRIHKNP